jgi:hypothetical protein
MEVYKMKKLRIIIFLSILLFGMCGCNFTINEESKNFNHVQPTESIKRVDDFIIEIYTENNEVIATITYVGEQQEFHIYHGGRIFLFNVYQVDGNYELLGAMEQPLLTTKLLKGYPHKETYNGPTIDTLKSGIYQFEAIAMFSLDEEVVKSKIEQSVQFNVAID